MIIFRSYGSRNIYVSINNTVMLYGGSLRRTGWLDLRPGFIFLFSFGSFDRILTGVDCAPFAGLERFKVTPELLPVLMGSESTEIGFPSLRSAWAGSRLSGD